MEDIDHEIAALLERARQLDERGDYDDAQAIYTDVLERMDREDPRYDEIASRVGSAPIQEPDLAKHASARVFSRSPVPLFKRRSVRWAAVLAIILIEIGMLLARNAQLQTLSFANDSTPVIQADEAQSTPPAQAPLQAVLSTLMPQATRTATLLPFRVETTQGPTVYATPIPGTPTYTFTWTPSVAPSNTPYPTPHNIGNAPAPTDTSIPLATAVPPAVPPPTQAPQPTPAPTAAPQPTSAPPPTSPPPTSEPPGPKKTRVPKPTKSAISMTWDNALSFADW